MDQTKKPDQVEQERAAAAVQAPAVAVGELLDEAGQRAREALQEVAAKALPSPKGRLHSHEAERGILCAILLDSEQYEEAVLQGLMAQDFHHPAHAMIFEAMVQLYQAHQPIDLVTLTQQLTDQGKLDAVGGQGVLLQLESLLATTAHAPAYVKLVQDKAILRKLVRAASDIVRWSFRPDKEAMLVIDQAEQAILSVRRETASKGIVPIHDLAVQALEHYEKLHKKEAMVAGIPSGFADLDQLTCGFQKGELTIIAARPSMGKTAFTLNIASHVAMRKQVPVAFFSLEMSAEQLMHRLMGSEARLDLSDLRRGHIRAKDYAALAVAAGRLGEIKMYIDETASLTIAQLRSKARHLVQRYGVQLVIVDYLQLMSSTSKYDNKATEVGEISKGLKTLARELQIAVVALSQLNRSVESRTDKRPMMSDLRESGAIEQDADVIAFLYREEYYLRDKTPQPLMGVAEVIIGKNRNGPTGALKLRFASNITRFDNLAHQPDAAPPPGVPT